jgi:hypothetical protein
MPFQRVSLHSIRSNNQRALATQWNMLAANAGFPSIGAFQPQAAGHSLEQIVLWDVDNTVERNARSFRVRQVGLRASEAFGGDMVGKTMEELVPPALRTISVNGARECVESGCAIYEIITTVDGNAHQVDCERLLLPFGEDGNVEQIVASLQLISFQGTVERQAIRHDFETGPQVTFSGMILSDAMARLGPEALADRKVRSAPSIVPVAAAQELEPVLVHVQAPESQGPEKRKAARRTALKTGRIRFGKTTENCTVRDMSAIGASIEVADAMDVPDRFSLVLEMESSARKCEVMWRRERQLGVKFG